jgi:hypothetical protein
MKNEEKVMHIDTSCKLYENKNTGISYKIVHSNEHRGLVLSKKLKKELRKNLAADKDYARVYAICIYYLIFDKLDIFDVLVICGDEKFALVKKYLNLLFKSNSEYLSKKVISIAELRKISGDEKLKSYADNSARAYRRRALKSLRRQQEGQSIVPIRINFKLIKNKWEELGKIM